MFVAAARTTGRRGRCTRRSPAGASGFHGIAPSPAPNSATMPPMEAAMSETSTRLEQVRSEISDDL